MQIRTKKNRPSHGTVAKGCFFATRSVFRRALGILLSLSILLSLMPAAAFAAEALTYTLVSGFNGGEGWTKVGSSTLAGDFLTFGSAGNNAFGYNTEIDAERYLISFDMTPNMAESPAAADLRVEFNATGSNATDMRLQVRFHFKENEQAIYVEQVKQENGTSNTTLWGGNSTATTKEFSWVQGQTYPVDIFVDGGTNTITVYFDGGEPWTVSNVPFDDASLGKYFVLGCQYANQNITVSNLKITTDEDPDSKAEAVADPVITVVNNQVTITCATEGATIYYTTNGDEPTNASTAYNAPFTLDETATVKAIAVKAGMTDSAIVSKTVNISESPDIGQHIDSLAYTLMEGVIGDASKWDQVTSSNGSGTFTFDSAADSVTVVGTGLNNAITYNGGKLQTADFLIQFDVTTPANKTDADDFKVRMKEDAGGNRLQVRFNFSQNVLGFEGINNTEAGASQWGWTATAGYSADFAWEPSTTYPVDILVAGDTVTIYWNGESLVSASHNDVDAMTPSALSFASQYGAQNHTIANLKVTTNMDPNAAPTRVATPVITANGAEVTITCDTVDAEIYYTIDGSSPTASSEKYTTPFTLAETATVKAIAIKGGLTASAVAEKQVVVANTDIVHALAPLSRVLLPVTALNSADNWDISIVSGSTITIAGGEAHLVTGGANNRMGYKLGKINADSFLIRFDYTINAESNTNTKIAFKCTDQYEGDRLQVRINPVQNRVAVEHGNASSTEGTGTYDTADFTWQLGHTYGIDILVEGSKIAVYIDGIQVLSADNAEISAMARGYFAISTQFPSCDVTVKNLSITTDEQQTGQQYTVTLKTATDGVVDAVPSGGTVTADALTGYAGDLITLTASPAHGYVLEKFTSFKEDGTSTDGLMPITNGTFTLDAKFGNVTVIAHFVKRVPGKFELFYDDFAAANIDASYTIKTPAQVSQDGAVTIDAEAGGSNYMLLNPDIFAPMKDGEGLRISVDAWKADSTAGTLQIMFKGSSFNDRYVLVINGNAAFFRHITATENVELIRTSYAFAGTKTSLMLEVEGDTAVFYADGREILRYTSPDSWGGADWAAGLINMTGGAPVCFDNFLVERIPAQMAVTVTSCILSGGVETVDADNTAGAVSVSSFSVVEGDQVTLAATVKAGYRLYGYTVMDGNGKNIPVSNDMFTVPDGAAGPITVKAVFEPSGTRIPRSFYIDSAAGSDSGDGTIGSPWKTLDKLAEYTQTDPLVPGDQVLLKRGSEFNGQQLRFSGMGVKNSPVVVTAYGDGSSLPRLNGEGRVENVVSLYNQEYITISGLEITNTDPAYNQDFTLNSSNNRTKTLRAINVSAKDFGTVSGIYIQDCYIHDINGNIGLKWNGGIFFDVQVSVDPATFTLTGVPTKYDDVLIEGCTIVNVDRSGIKLVNSGWCNQWLANDASKPINWYPSTNVVVRNNYLEKIGGDGITTRDTDGALIEHNLVKDCRYQDTGYNVGIWPFEAANTVIQYNEAYNTHSTDDGQGLDCDHASSYSLMQYNYSHNNEGGFMLIMGGYPHTAATVRYNISQNDYDKTFEFAQGIPMGTMIYNNTFYSKDVVSRGVLYLSNTSVGRGVNDFYLFNNLFIYPAGQTFYGGSEAAALPGRANLYNNGYVGLSAPTEESHPIIAADAASVLAGAGSGPETNAALPPITGGSGRLSGYQLAEDSPMLDVGVTLAEAIAYFGGEGFQVLDGRSMSPNALEALYYGKGEISLKYVMGEYFPRISGIDYTLDFFGNPYVQNGAPDIGAAETLDHVHTGGTANCAAGAECSICGKHYGAIDPDNHTGNTEVRNHYAATETQPGYTGDIYCADCGVLLQKGETIPATGAGHTHSGGTATCVSGKVCEICGETYGDIDPDRHTGRTEIRGASASYTGDTYCADCGALLATGMVIPTGGGSVVLPDAPGTGSGTGSSAGSDTDSDTDSALPVTTANDTDDVTTSTATIPASSSNGTASAAISPEIAAEIIRQAKENGSEAVIIALTISGNVSKTEVDIPASLVSTLGSETGASLTVESHAAKVTIGNQALAALGASARTVTITVDSSAADTVDIVVAKDGKKLDTISGGLKVEIPMAGASSGQVAILVAADGTETILKKAVAVDGVFNLSLDGSAEIKFKDNSKNFADTGGHWAREAIDFVSSRGLFSGVSEDRFAANGDMSRAMLVTVLHRLEDTPASGQISFMDVAQDTWYSEAVSWAASSGITTGSGSGFDPDGIVNREQLVTFLYRYAQAIGMDVSTHGSIAGFGDSGTVSNWAETAMQWAVGEGIINGKDGGRLAPADNATRAETATILMRFCKSIALKM